MPETEPSEAVQIAGWTGPSHALVKLVEIVLVSPTYTSPGETDAVP